MKKYLLILCLVSLMSACARMALTHPYKNASDFERDKYECRLVAEQSASNQGYGNNVFLIANEINTCLQMRYGWEPMASGDGVR